MNWEHGQHEPHNHNYSRGRWVLEGSSRARVVVEGPCVAVAGYEVVGGRKVYPTLEAAQAAAVERLYKKVREDLKMLEEIRREK